MTTTQVFIIIIIVKNSTIMCIINKMLIVEMKKLQKFILIKINFSTFDAKNRQN